MFGMMMTYRGVDYVYNVVIQVSPTPKVSVGRPTNLHDLLAQLGLSHYEPKFVEQDVDLEVCAYLISTIYSCCNKYNVSCVWVLPKGYIFVAMKLAEVQKSLCLRGTR